MIRTIRWIIFLLSVAAPPALASKIINIDVEKRVITIDEGTDTKYVKKAKVCFYDASNVKVGCSFIRTAKPRISFIKIKGEKLFAKLQVGMLSKMEGGPPPPGLPGAPGITAEVPPPIEVKEKAPNYIMALFLQPLVGPISYQNLIYETPVGNPVNSMWSSDSTVKNVGFGLEFGLGLSSFQLAAGLRARLFLPKKISSDYDDVNLDNNFEQFMDTVATGSSFGAWLDFHFLRVDFGVVDFRLGGGLEVDNSSVIFEAVQKSDDDRDAANVLYAGKSTLTALSLRLLPTLGFVFGPMDFTIGSILYIPVAQTSKFSLDTLEDPFISNLDPEKTPEGDLKDALKHEAKFGLDLLLSVGFVF